MAKSKKQKLKDLHITDGKNRAPKTREQEIQEIKNLEEILGLNTVNPYGTANKAIFAEKVELMTLEDMTALAIRVGVMPTSRQSEMRKRLLDNFDDFLRRHHISIVGPTKPAIDPNSEAYKQIKDLIGF